MDQETFVTGRINDKCGNRGWKEYDQYYECPWMYVTEQITQNIQNRNYDLTRLARNWDPDQNNPKLLAPQLKGRRRLLGATGPCNPNTFLPRITLTDCERRYGYPEVDEDCGSKDADIYESMARAPTRDYEESDYRTFKTEENISVDMNNAYVRPGLVYDPPGYDTRALNFDAPTLLPYEAPQTLNQCIYH